MHTPTHPIAADAPLSRSWLGKLPWYGKLCLATLLLLVSFSLDQLIAAWSFAHPNPFLTEIQRELRLIEQYGQWLCSVLLICAVALIDREGRRKAFFIATSCLLTFIVCFLLKGLFGRLRPETVTDSFQFLGPAFGFFHGHHYQSFPSAHTTGAFALSIGLAYFYPSARLLFYSLAGMTALLRIVYHAHYLSDVIGGILLAALVFHYTLRWHLPDRLLAKFPDRWQKWLLQ